MSRITLKIFCLLLTLIFFFISSVAPALAAITYTYDANGNMTSDGTKCYEYNEANQQKKVKNCSNSQTIAEYVYDYQGNRLVKKTYSNGTLQKTTFSPNDGYETVKLASNSAIQNTSYYFANDQLIAKKNPDGTKNYYHNDHLGSTNVMTNQSGGLVEETKYDPWGEIKAGGTKSKFLYTGQEKDLETGLNYYNARYYDSHIRRFTQPDDFIQDPFNPQNLNRYSYVLNNPLRYTDPTGNYVETALDLAFIAADLNDIKNDPINLWNWAAFGGDIAGTALPAVTGVGLGIKIVEHGGDVDRVISGYTKAQEVIKTVQLANQGKGANNAANAIRLSKSLAHQEQKSEVGKIIAGNGSKATFRDAVKIAKQFGGSASDWVKKTSTSVFKAADGTQVQTHWVENLKTGFKTLFKPKITYPKPKSK